MKKSLLSVALIACFSLASAQTEQGRWLVGSSSTLSYTSVSYSGTSIKNSEFRLQLSAGHFVADNFNLGFFIGTTTTKIGFNDSKFTTSTFGPYGRYYIEGTFFIGAGYVISKESLSSDGPFGGGDEESSFNQVLLEAGYPIWVKENIAVEPGLVYLMGTGDFDGVNSLAIGVGFSLYF